MLNFTEYNAAAENSNAGIAYDEHGQNWEGMETAIATDSGNNELVLIFDDNSRIIFGSHTDIIIPDGYTDEQVFAVLGA